MHVCFIFPYLFPKLSYNQSKLVGVNKSQPIDANLSSYCGMSTKGHRSKGLITQKTSGVSFISVSPS